MMFVGAQLSVSGLYLPPVFREMAAPQIIISVPVHTAVCSDLASGAFVRVVAVQLFVAGLYLPPVFKFPRILSNPPQMIIWLPLQTAE